MNVGIFCKAIQIIILCGYDLNYYNIIYAFPEHLDNIILLFDNNEVLTAIEQNNKWTIGSIKNIIEIFNKYKKTKYNYEEIKSLSTNKFDLICYDYLNIKNKLINEIYFCGWTYFNYSISKIINNNQVSKFSLSSGKLGHRFEMYNLNKFLLNLNINEDIESFGFADMTNLDFDIILCKLPNLKSLYLTATLVYQHDKLIPLDVFPIMSKIQYTNLTTLSLQNFCERLTNDHLFQLMSMFPNLTSLSLRYSEIEDDSLLRLFDTSKKITTLQLDSCKKLSGDIMYLIPLVYPNIENLKTTNIVHVNDNYVIHMLRNCKKLKDFEIDPLIWHNDDQPSLNLIACVYKYFNKTWLSYRYSEAIKNLNEQEYQNFLNEIH
jgi:hypothetical protein